MFLIFLIMIGIGFDVHLIQCMDPNLIDVNEVVSNTDERALFNPNDKESEQALPLKPTDLDLADQQLLVNVMFGRIRMDCDEQRALVKKILGEED